MPARDEQVTTDLGFWDTRGQMSESLIPVPVFFTGYFISATLLRVG